MTSVEAITLLKLASDVWFEDSLSDKERKLNKKVFKECIDAIEKDLK